MTTLSAMKTRIAKELRRLGSGATFDGHVADAISTAIAQLEAERFYFNESRSFVIPTVPGKSDYGAADSALIPRILKFDYVKLIIGGTVAKLWEDTPERIEDLLQNGVSTGQPISYCWYGNTLRVYPTPPEVWTIRIAGLVKMPAPASDDEPDNPWMTAAEKLVRCYAKYELYENVLFDPEKAATFNPNNDAGPTGDAKRTLVRRTNNLAQQGGWVVTPVQF